MAKLDDRLRRDLDRAGRPADPSGVYEELIRRRERRRIARRVQAGLVAVVVIAGTIAGTYALSRVFRTGATEPGGSPSTSSSSSPTPSAQPTSDIGLGFAVCNVTSVEGVFLPSGTTGTAYVATKRGDTGGCPQAGDNVVAIDLTGDGEADTSYGPIGCEQWCSAFAALDVDNDGIDEILVQNVQFSVAGLKLFKVGVGGPTDSPVLSPVTVGPPGDPGGGFESGKEPQLWLGGDAFRLDALRCDTGRDGRVLVATSAESRPHDSPDAVWQAHETMFVLRHDGVLDVVGTRDFKEPATSAPPSFASGTRLCGVRLPGS